MRHSIWLAALPLAVVVGPLRAEAQEARLSGELVVATAATRSVRSYAEDALVSHRDELELSSSFLFITSSKTLLPGPDDGALRFTDVGILRGGFRYAFARRLEVSGGVDVLAKQPSFIDEPVFNAGALGLRLGLTDNWALWASGSTGPMLGHLGAWGDMATGVQARTSIDETVRFQAALGGSFTRLFYDDGGWPWFAEVVAHGELLLRSSRRGEFAGWLGIDYRVPVAHKSESREIDPKVRLNFELGLMLGYVEDWDLFAVFDLIDRGDVADPTTTLPILNGGFDQMQLLLGVAHRFDLTPNPEAPSHRHMNPM